MSRQKIVIKVTLIGDAAVGKTSLRNRFMGKGFRGDHLMTIAADFAVKEDEITVDDKKYSVAYQVWDMAGDKKFTQLRTRFFNGTMAGLCVFDVTKLESFNSVPKWIEEIWKNNGQGVIPIILLGNKSDLRDKKSIPVTKGQEYAKMLSGRTSREGYDVHYMDTSAKDGINIKEAFHSIGTTVIRKMLGNK
ncbi:MAG: GTP-binding protein [Candidatus Heimdallarchaeota archaeon]|nr:GTP-binding protein [Candidatus Heimdallarchaeota archaeon]